MIDPVELEVFRAWALERYTRRSTTKLVGDLRTMVEHKGKPPSSERLVARLKDYRWAWDVWNDARLEIGGGKLSELGLPRPELPVVSKRGGRRSKEPKRLREAKALSSEAYQAFLGSIHADDRVAARVVEIMAQTGLRVADVLRVRVELLGAALRDGAALPIVVKGDKPTLVSLEPARAAWTRAYGASWRGAVTLADAVTGQPGSDTEASGAAYERCRRVMKRHGLALAIDGRLHLHRLRRTVGVELLRRGASIEDVQQVMIHDSVEVTERSYTDEYRAEQAATALGRLKGRT